jgi:PQQ-like domain
MLTLAVLLLSLLTPAADAVQEDEKLVKDAGFDTDKAGLLDFFRKRSLTDVQRQECLDLIQKLGSTVYEERKHASKELTRHGSVVKPLLKDALKNGDAEIVRRAHECLDQLDDANPAAPVSAARLLLQRAPEEAIPALLDYLPYAAGDQEMDDLLAVLIETCPLPEKMHPALPLALSDELTARRATAAYVLGRKGTAAHRDAVHKLLADKDCVVRYRAALGLLAAEDKAAVPALFSLLEDAPITLAWQAEDVLFGLAADRGPTGGIGPDSNAAERRKCRELWTAWWKDNEAKVDLKQYLEGERTLGLTLGIEYNTGRVWECGRDKTLRWEIKGLQGPMEAQVLPGNQVLIVESRNMMVTVRDFKGNIRWEKKLESAPTGCQRLPNGNTFISSYNSVLELDPKGEQVYAFSLNGGSNAIRKARNGHVIYATANEIVEVDTANKAVRTVPLPAGGNWIGIQDLLGDRFVATNSGQGKVVEVDATGKVLWEVEMPRACGVARLPNGHTLVSAGTNVVEFDEKKTKVWEMTVEGNGSVRRIHRR